MTTREKAYREYIARQRGTVAVGTWEKPNDWKDFSDYDIPSHERQPCCDKVTRTNLCHHVKTAKHVAYLFGLDPTEFSTYVMRRRIVETKRKRREGA